MVGKGYWSIGVHLKPFNDRWIARVEFCDDGFCENGSTEGALRIRYPATREELIAEVRTLIEDAKRLGIEFRNPIKPSVYMENDGRENGALAFPNDWKEVVAEVAERFSLRDPYAEKEPVEA